MKACAHRRYGRVHHQNSVSFCFAQYRFYEPRCIETADLDSDPHGGYVQNDPLIRTRKGPVDQKWVYSI